MTDFVYLKIMHEAFSKHSDRGFVGDFGVVLAEFPQMTDGASGGFDVRGWFFVLQSKVPRCCGLDLRPWQAGALHLQLTADRGMGRSSARTYDVVGSTPIWSNSAVWRAEPALWVASSLWHRRWQYYPHLTIRIRLR